MIGSPAQLRQIGRVVAARDGVTRVSVKGRLSHDAHPSTVSSTPPAVGAARGLSTRSGYRPPGGPKWIPLLNEYVNEINNLPRKILCWGQPRPRIFHELTWELTPTT